MTFRPSGSWGQHYLRSSSVIARIIEALDPQPGETIIEVGSGLGALTIPLWELSQQVGFRVIAIEPHAQSIEELGARLPDLPILPYDGKTYDFTEIDTGPHVKVVGNLPYNVSTRILDHLIEHFAEHSSRWIFMFQLEVADRILARPGEKPYGLLAVTTQLATQPRRVMVVGRKAFVPPPKVTSAVVAFEVGRRAPYHPHYREFRAFVGSIFSMKRKKLGTIFRKRGYTQDLLEAVGLSPELRPQNVTPEQYLEMFKRHMESGGQIEHPHEDGEGDQPPQ